MKFFKAFTVLTFLLMFQASALACMPRPVDVLNDGTLQLIGDSLIFDNGESITADQLMDMGGSLMALLDDGLLLIKITDTETTDKGDNFVSITYVIRVVKAGEETFNKTFEHKTGIRADGSQPRGCSSF